MNYIVNSPSALVNHSNYSLSPLINDDKEQTSSFAALPAILGVVSSVVPALPQMGIGSRSRRKETKAQADADTQVINAQLELAIKNQEASEKKAKEEKTFLIIGGAFLLVMLVVIMAFIT